MEFYDIYQNIVRYLKRVKNWYIKFQIKFFGCENCNVFVFILILCVQGKKKNG